MSDAILKSVIETSAKALWPIVIFIIFFILRNPIKLLLLTLKNKIDASGNFKITTTGIEFEQIKTSQDQIDVIQNKLLVIERKLDIKQDGTESKILQEFKILAKEFNEAQDIKDKVLRVKRKEDLASNMGRLIVNNAFSKEEISKVGGEGAYVGLMYSIIFFPEKEDKKFIFELYDKANHPFSKNAVLKAVETLLKKEYIPVTEYQKIEEIVLKCTDPDEYIIKRIDKIERMIA